jgi:hypothetical protein
MMIGQARGTTYKDQAALTLESDALAAQFLPGTGAKLASLFLKPRGLELLVQRPGGAYLTQPYAGDYVAGECSGFDDMFPTIDACHYPAFPWAGTPIPDHGEVWSLPWSAEEDGGRLRFAVHGVRFPYRLEKWASFADPATLRLEYRLTNLSPFDFDFLWAAHAMFYLEEETELILPPGVRQVASRLSLSGELGRYGDAFDWPCFVSPSGAARDLRRIRPPSARDAEKYFVKGAMPDGWCALRYQRSGFTLKMSFPVERVPYLGILPNEGGWQGLYNIFLEPCTASFDDLNAARLRGECSTVRAGATYDWWLEIGVDCSG